MPDLETVSLEGVEILEADVTIHGVGSPPEGDRWSTDDLRAMAQAAQELEAAGEWRIPTKVGAEPLGITKLGHGKDQKLLDAGELPAAGWLTNQRVSDDGKKLLADITDIPRKLADLIKAKAYRQRSSELGSVKSQKTGKSYPWVVTGLAHLGGKMPAVRTLDEIVALYEGDESERRFMQLDEVGGASVDELRDALASVGTDLAREFQESDASGDVRADIRRTMPETKYTDEQRRKFAEAIPGDTLKVEDVTDEMLANAGVAVVEEPKVDADKQLEDDKSRRDLEARVEKTERELAEERKELHEERKRNFVEGLVTARKITPGDSDKWAKRYDADPQAAREYAEDLEVHDELDREYGADSEEILDDDALEAQNKSYAEETSARIGIPVEQVI